MIERIKTIPITAIADQLGIEYKPSGKYRIARCFMHDDHHPSMWLNVAKNNFYCPVCSKGGDGISLVEEFLHIGFNEAKEWFDNNFGISSGYKAKAPICHPLHVVQAKAAATSLPLPASVLGHPFQELSLPLVTNGILTEEQMQRAVNRYHLTTTKDNGVIFWRIDCEGNIIEGKVMYYKADAHRDGSHKPTTVSSLMKSQNRIEKEWSAAQSFFGLHLITPDVTTVAIVESEKTAIICSERLKREGIEWIASGGLSNISAEMFIPLKGKRIILFPDTDTTGDTYRKWCKRAKEAEPVVGCSIYVSPLLEQNATATQKTAKIDIADLLWKVRG